jgi:hypothetical protein
VFESARFTPAAVIAEGREHLLSLPVAPKVIVECRYLSRILNQPRFVKLVLILVQFPFPEGGYDFDILAEYLSHHLISFVKRVLP